MKKIFFLLCIIFFLLVSVIAFAKEVIIFSLTDPVKDDGKLFIMNPQGGKTQEIFSFHTHPKIRKGSIYTPRIAKDGKTIYFSSDNAFAYTPFRANIFRVASDGSWVDQITPNSNSGRWDVGCPCGIVKGKVLHPGSKMPWGGCPVFLEGKGMVYSGSNGTFTFKDVPSGVRFVVGYKPGSSVFDAKPINVVPDTEIDVVLVPNSNYKTGFYSPIPVKEKVYFKFGMSEIQWTDVEATHYNEVYKAKGVCSGIADIDGFDVNPQTEAIAVMDYQTGCTTNRGLYLISKGNISLLWDMKQENGISGGRGVYWTYNGKRLAVEVSYNNITYIIIIDVEKKRFLSSFPFPNGYTIYDIELYGFSPSGEWLLFSYRIPSTDKWVLTKIRVNKDGILDANSMVSLFKSSLLTGATWGILASPPPLPEGAIKIKKF